MCQDSVSRGLGGLELHSPRCCPHSAPRHFPVPISNQVYRNVCLPVTCDEGVRDLRDFTSTNKPVGCYCRSWQPSDRGYHGGKKNYKNSKTCQQWKTEDITFYASSLESLLLQHLLPLNWAFLVHALGPSGVSLYKGRVAMPGIKIKSKKHSLWWRMASSGQHSLTYSPAEEKPTPLGVLGEKLPQPRKRKHDIWPSLLFERNLNGKVWDLTKVKSFFIFLAPFAWGRKGSNSHYLRKHPRKVSGELLEPASPLPYAWWIGSQP